MLELLSIESFGPLLFAAAQLHLRGGEVAQTLLPFGFQPAGDQPVLGLHGPVTALRALRFVASALHFQPPLRQSRVVVALELLD